MFVVSCIKVNIMEEFFINNRLLSVILQSILLGYDECDELEVMEDKAKDCKLKIRSKDNFKNRFFFQIYLKIKGLLRLHRNLTSNVFTCQRYMHKDTSRKDSNIWFEILNICLYTKLQDMLWVLLMTIQMSVWFFFCYNTHCSLNFDGFKGWIEFLMG